MSRKYVNAPTISPRSDSGVSNLTVIRSQTWRKGDSPLGEPAECEGPA
jgi:hypothetical protein